jgi:hypothetical protein
MIPISDRSACFTKGKGNWLTPLKVSKGFQVHAPFADRGPHCGIAVRSIAIASSGSLIAFDANAETP